MTVKKAKNPIVIGVSGVRGSFSEMAGEAYAAKKRLKQYTIKHLVTVEHVLAAVERGDVAVGVFPVANSSMGVVLEAMHAVSRYRFTMKEAFTIQVVQNLLARPGVAARDIRTIVSQLPALEQCKLQLKHRWPRAKLKEYADTAKAAKDLAAGKLPRSTAVVASAAAAKLYGLNIVAPAIQDHKNNATFFIAAVK
ncbi:MAG: prephenate dehydratase domain-containing protein [Patescibacteria group bacterium]